MFMTITGMHYYIMCAWKWSVILTILKLIHIQGSLSHNSSLIELSLNNDRSQDCSVFKSVQLFKIHCPGDLTINVCSNGFAFGLSIVCHNSSYDSLPEAFYSDADLSRVTYININGCQKVKPFIDGFLEVAGGAMNLTYLHVTGDENAVLNLNDTTFTNLHNLRDMRIYYTHIQDVPSGIFPNSLNTLYLSDSNITELREDLFFNTTTLENLYIVFNQLTHLPASIFHRLTKLKTLNLYQNRITSLHPDLFYGLGSLTTLALDRNQLQTLPNNVFRSLANLTSLALSNNTLTNITKELLQPLKSLRNLLLSSTNLQALENDMFDDLEQIESIYVSKNSLRSIPDGILPSRITNFDISYNKVLKIAGNIIFKNVSKIGVLGMKDCGIERVTYDFLTGAQNLWSFDLSQNEIQELPDIFLEDSKRLTYLYLDHNRLSSLPANLCEHKNLRKLSASYNRLKQIHPQTFQNLSYLVLLDLSHNEIEFLDAATFNGVSTLENLDLSHNKLHDIPTIFSSLRRVENFNLSFNEIQSVENVPFSNTLYLETLDLSFNKLSKIKKFSKEKLPSLKHLYLDNNFIVEINREAFQSLTALTTLNLANNFLSFNSRLSTTPKQPPEPLYYTAIESCRFLQHLDISNNSLTQIFPSWRMLFRSLSYLGLAHNQIQVLTSFDLLYEPYNISVDLRHNRVSSVILKDKEITVVEESKSQVVLDLNDNPINCNCAIFNFFRFQERDITIQHDNLNVGLMRAGRLACASPPALSQEIVEDIESWSPELIALLGLCKL